MTEEIAKKGTVAARQEEQKRAILEQLRQVPIIQTACGRAGISRASFYRLRTEDKDFKASVEEAIAEGVSFINDMSETQLISLIKEKNWPAISFWLRAHHPAYRSRIDISARVAAVPAELTPEQERAIERAVKLASLVEDADEASGNQDIDIAP